MLIADAHVHLYDNCNLDRAFESAFANLGRLRGAAGDEPEGTINLALLLTERHDCRAFERLRDGAGRGILSAHQVEVSPEEQAVILRNGAGDRLYVFAGRQVATRERLEILALGGDPGVADGGDILDTIGRVREGGAVPALAWAPGKWLGPRGGIAAAVIDGASAGQLLIGDSSMRPRGWPTPAPMREAALRGLAVVGGTDPLPFAGQESVIGRYATRIAGGLDARAPVSSLRALLTGDAARVSLVGRRDSLVSVGARLLRHRLAG